MATSHWWRNMGNWTSAWEDSSPFAEYSHITAEVTAANSLQNSNEGKFIYFDFLFLSCWYFSDKAAIYKYVNNHNASVGSSIGRGLCHFTPHRNLDISFILLLIPGIELYLLILVSLTFLCNAALPMQLWVAYWWEAGPQECTEPTEQIQELYRTKTCIYFYFRVPEFFKRHHWANL